MSKSKSVRGHRTTCVRPLLIIGRVTRGGGSNPFAGTAAQSQDLSKFPDWKGQWVRIGGGGQFDPTKPPVRGQQPPLKPEFQAIWEANIAEARTGGQYYNTQVRCMPGGMPRMMMAYEPMEVIVLPDITYIHITFNSEFRRIYTDGRDWPKDPEASFSGYSVGKWIDTDGDGRYDTLEVETRYLKGPRRRSEERRVGKECRSRWS